MHRGSCLCGRVRYEYDGTLDEISLCHCGQCRKAQGTAFAAVTPIRAADFRIVAGGESLKSYRATPGKARVFCGECGSPIYSARDDMPEVKRLRIGTLDTPLADVRERYHIFVAYKAPWYDIEDDWTRYRGPAD